MMEKYTELALVRGEKPPRYKLRDNVLRVVEATNQHGTFKFLLAANFTGHWDGFVLSHPESLEDGEPYYCKFVDEFVKDFPEYGNYEFPYCPRIE